MVDCCLGVSPVNCPDPALTIWLPCLLSCQSCLSSQNRLSFSLFSVILLEPEGYSISVISSFIGCSLDVPERGCFPKERLCHRCSV